MIKNLPEFSKGVKQVEERRRRHSLTTVGDEFMFRSTRATTPINSDVSVSEVN